LIATRRKIVGLYETERNQVHIKIILLHEDLMFAGCS